MAKIKCKHCNYEWETASKMMFVSCPSCLKKVQNLNKSEVKNVKGNKVVNLENKEQDSGFNSGED